MVRIVRGALFAALVGVFAAAAAAADEEPLTEKEKVFIHAAGLLVEEPGNDKNLADRARESAEKGAADQKWAKSENPVLRALASIGEKPELRARYRTNLKMLLGNEPEANAKKLLAQIESGYTKEKIRDYTATVEKAADGQKLAPGSLPFPVCVPFNCCKE